jgi:hypothetical protein
MAGEFETLDVGALEHVTGGRITGSKGVSSETIELIAKVGEMVPALGQNLEGAKQARTGQMMQVMQQAGADPRMLTLMQSMAT